MKVGGSVLFLLAVAAASMVACQDTPITDTFPVLAQLKSLYQLVLGDPDGAAKTQQNYLNEGIGTAQARSVYFLATGDAEKALDIQKKFAKNMELLIDGVPGLGHLKGLGHLLAGDTEHGLAAIKSASSSTGAVIGGVLGGPLGSIAGHALTDLAISGVDSAINGNNSHPHGILAYTERLGELSAGESFDAITGLVMDGIGGGRVNGAKHCKTAGNGGRKPRPPVGEELALTSSISKSTESLSDRVQIESETDVEVGCCWDQAKTIDEQAEVRRSYDLSKYTIAEYENEMSFNRYVNYIREYELYRPWRLTYHSYEYFKLLLTFREVENYKSTEALLRLDVDSLKNKLGYLTDTQKSMITPNEFRTVNIQRWKAKNCAVCSVAGLLETDAETLLTKINSLGNMYSIFNGLRMEKFLMRCKESIAITRFTVSPTLTGLRMMKSYLETFGEKLENKPIILVQINASGMLGHAVVIKYKFEVSDPRSDPSILLVDYQQPGLLHPEVPNPLRFTPYVDTLQFFQFKLIRISYI